MTGTYGTRCLGADLAACESEARQRGATYANLAVLFADSPSEVVLSTLVGVVGSTEGDAAGMEGLRAYFDGQRDGIDESLRCAVASEYADLFVGPRPPQAPMYESVYLGTPKRLFTEQTMLVRHFYARCGLAVVKSDKVPDDYLPYELELISSLALREADAAGRGDVRGADEARELQLEFLRAHLGRWMEPFSCRVIQAESSDFYAALVAFARDFIADDETYLAHSVDEAGMSVTEGALR